MYNFIWPAVSNFAKCRRGAAHCRGRVSPPTACPDSARPSMSRCRRREPLTASQMCSAYRGAPEREPHLRLFESLSASSSSLYYKAVSFGSVVLYVRIEIGKPKRYTTIRFSFVGCCFLSVQYLKFGLLESCPCLGAFPQISLASPG